MTVHLPDSLLISEIEPLEEGPPRKRPIRRETVDALKESIARIGLKTPISVRFISNEKGWRVVTGAHRYIACKELGRDAIAVRVETGTEEDAELWEIDENLIREDLTSAQRTEHKASREELRARIAAALKADPNIKLRELAEKTGTNRTTAGEVRNELRR
jgi:ParB/RepB/Spo0J family partition protein